MENSKKVTILLAIVFLIIILGIHYFNRAGVLKIPGLKSPGTFEAEEDLLKKEVKLQEQMAEIVKTNDFEKCEQIKDETYQKACVNNIAMNLAKEKEDVSYCERIDGKLVSIEDCEREIIFQKSLEKEDIGICQETKNLDLQNECMITFWNTMAVKKQDINLCDNFQDNNLKEACKDNYIIQDNLKQSKSTRLDNSMNTSSFSKEAQILYNLKCEKLFSSQAKQDCITFKSAIDSNKLEDCHKIKTAMFLRACIDSSRIY